MEYKELREIATSLTNVANKVLKCYNIKSEAEVIDKRIKIFFFTTFKENKKVSFKYDESTLIQFGDEVTSTPEMNIDGLYTNFISNPDNKGFKSHYYSFHHFWTSPEALKVRNYFFTGTNRWGNTFETIIKYSDQVEIMDGAKLMIEVGNAVKEKLNTLKLTDSNFIVEVTNNYYLED